MKSILTGKRCILRALEPEDLDFLYTIENDLNIWEISNTLAPYSKALLQDYLSNAHRDIYEVKQLRLCICAPTGERLGLIDLFNYDPKHKRAGIGVILAYEKDRKQGIGTEAVTLLLNYAFSVLELHQVYANMLEDNTASKQLFERLGFHLVGAKKDWIYWNGSYKHELMYQKIRS
ncbi:MAG: GNAT family protein [Bacteroidota bacterium]